jgi:hypothetical protein
MLKYSLSPADRDDLAEFIIGVIIDNAVITSDDSDDGHAERNEDAAREVAREAVNKILEKLNISVDIL